MPHQFEDIGFEADDIPHVDVVKVQTISRFITSVPKVITQFFFSQLWFNKENVSVDRRVVAFWSSDAVSSQ